MLNFLKHFGVDGQHGGNHPAYTFDFDQCAFGLKSPAGVSPAEIWKKTTTLLTNIPGLSCCARSCPGNHTHTPIFGAVRVHGKSVLRSKLAGRYPSALCRSIAVAALPYLRPHG